PLKHRMFQCPAVILNFVRNPIDDDRVRRRVGHSRSAPADHLGGDPVPRPFLVHPGDERRREAVLTADEKPYRLGRARCRTHTFASPRRSTPARVSLTMCRTTAFKSPVSRNTASCCSALVPSRSTVCTYFTAS